MYSKFVGDATRSPTPPSVGLVAQALLARCNLGPLPQIAGSWAVGGERARGSYMVLRSAKRGGARERLYIVVSECGGVARVLLIPVPHYVTSWGSVHDHFHHVLHELVHGAGRRGCTCTAR